MKARLALLALLLVGTLASGAQAQVDESSGTSAGTTSSSTSSGVSSDSYIVTFSAGTSDSSARALLSSVDATVDSYIAPLRMYSVSLPGAASAATLQADPSVSRVDANQERGVATIPNDTSYSDQWALPRIGWEAARDTVSPSGSATVAILDTGVDATHPDLDGNLVAGTSILDGGDSTTDPNGHGTQMAGIVAAETDNSEGIAGVGYAGVKVMPVTVLGADGTGQDSDIISGVVWAADHGADVILMSFSNPGYSESLQAAIDYAWSQNVVLVAATGNGGSTEPTFPAGDRGVIGVSSTGLTDGLSSTSNYGPATFLAAPGEGILATIAGGGYGEVSGTSAAAAIVAGSAALLRASSVGASNGVIVSRLARNAEPAGTADQTGNGRVNLDRAILDTSSDSIQPAGAAPVGGGGPFVGPYVLAANNDAHVAPEWAPGSTTVTFNTLYRVTTGGTVQHVRVTLPAGYSNISAGATAFSSGTWAAPVVSGQSVDVSLSSGTGLVVGGWARIDVTATTPASQSGNAAKWLLETFTNTAGTSGKQDDDPPVLVNDTTNPTATITFVDAGGTAISSPVLQNGLAAIVRVRLTQTGSGIKYADIAVPTCFSTPTAVTTSVSTGGTGGYAVTQTDGFIHLKSGSVPTNGSLTAQFTTTPNCVSGTYTVTSSPSTNATNPPSTDNQAVAMSGGSLTVAAGLADLSITKTDSPDPVARGGTLTYTIGVSNAGPNDASAVKVVDTLPAAATFVSATAPSNWTCNHVSGTVTCNRTGGNLPTGAAPNITIVVTAPTTGTSPITLTNSATVSSPNDNTPDNNTATTTTAVNSPPSLTAPTFSPTAPKTNDMLQASTVTSDIDGDQVSVAWTWKITRGANTCTIQTNSSALAAAGTRTSSLDLSLSYATSSCTGATPPASINPSKGDVVIVEATPTDAPGLSGAMETSSVTIANSEPTVAFTASPASANEGQTKTYTFATTDADGDTLSFAAGYPTCGTGGTLSGSPTVSGGTFDCSFADDSPTATASDPSIVAVKVTDGTDQSNEATQTVTVSNVAPTVVISGDASQDESQTLRTYTFDTTDPGAPDTFTAGIPDCGASGTFVGPITFSAATGDGSFDCRFADDDPTATASDLSTLSITITDDDTGAGNDTHAVTVNNVAPTVVITGTSPVSESQTLVTYSFDTTDPGTLDTFTAGTPSCGASGTFVGPITFSAATGDGSFDCRFADDSPTATSSDTSTLSITVTDDDTGADSDTKDVTVNNVDPSVVISGLASQNESQTLRTYSFDTTDPGTLDTFTAGTPSCGASGTFVGPITFNAATGDGSFDCRFADDSPTATASDTSTLSITVTDDDTGADTDTKDVTVNNVAPTVVISGALNADEGDTKTYNFDTTDPGTPDTFTHGTPSCGTGSLVGLVTFSAATGDGSFDCKFTDDDPTGTASDPTSVSITVTDDDTGSDSDSFALTVHNLDPTVVVTGAANADEGDTKTYSFNTTDTGTADTFTHGTPSCGTGSLVGLVTFSAATGDGSFDCKFTDDDPTGTASDPTSVSITVTDDDTGSDSDSFALTVHNLDPTVVVTGAANADEGDTKTYSFNTTDTGTADTFTHGTPSCGTGSLVGLVTFSAATGDGSFDCKFTDDDPTGTASDPTSVSITVTDDDTGSDSDSFALTVHNLDPTVVVTGAANADEGDTKTYSFNTTDTGTADTFTHGTPSCGTGSLVGLVTFSAATGDGSFDCKFTDDDPTGTASDPTSVSITVTDDDTGSDSDSFALTVHNLDPTVVVTGAANADEGDTKTYSFNTTDTGTADTFTHGTPSCGTGSLVGLVTFSAATGDGSFDCKFTDDDPTGTASDPTSVSITVTDDDTGSDSDSFALTVHNLDPTVVVTGAANADEGDTKTYSFNTTDTGTADTFTHGTPSCGTGSLVGLVTFSAATGDGSFDCKFTDDDPTGTASDPTSVSITVTDDDTGSDSDSFALTVHNLDPTVVISGASPVNESQTLVTYNFDTTDAGTLDTFTAGTPSCGASGTFVGPIVFSAATGDGSFDCRFADDSPTATASDLSTVSVTVTDDDTGAGTGTKVVTVNNVAPTVVITGASPVNESQTLVTYNFDTTDPGTLDAFTHSTPSCGTSGTFVGPITFSAATGDGSFDCRFADDSPTATASDTSTVSITITDDDTGSDDDTKDVTVNNVDPTVVVTGTTDADEGETKTFDFDTTDPGTLDTFTHGTPSCGTGSPVGLVTFSAATGDGSFDCKFTDDDPTGTASDPTSVSITVTDDDTGSDSDTLNLTVHNLDPTVVVSGALNANEGDTKTYSFDTTDAGTADTFTHGTPSCGTGSPVGLVTFSAATGDGSFDCKFTDDDPTGTASDDTTVSITVDDDDLGSGGDTFDLTVHNLDPTVVVTGPANADEGETKTYDFDTTDAGTADTFTHGTPSCDTGSLVTGSVVFSTATGDGSFECKFTDDSPTGTSSDPTSVSITVTDDDTGSDSDSFNLTVHNLDPTVVVTGPANADEGETKTYDFDTTDAGTADTFTHGTPSCGTGSLVTGSVVFSTATGDGSFECKFTDDNPTGTASDPTSVSITVDDDDLGSDDDAFDLTVHNLDPSVDLTGPATADEGETKTYGFDTTDAGSADTFTHGTPDCGIGTYVPLSVSFDTATGDGSFDCKFTDDNPTGTSSDATSVSITVTDDDTGSDSDDAAVTVHNLDPSVDLTGPTDADEGETKTYDFDTTDAGTADTFTHGTPDCGTGSLVGPVVFSTATGDGSFDCKFTDDNPTGTSSDPTSVSITITDDDTGSDSDDAALTVHNLEPTVELSGAANVDEGGTETYSFDTTDAGTADTFTDSTPDCGTGTLLPLSIVFSTATGDGSFDCKFTDDDPTGTASDPTSVSITVNDDDLGSDDDSLALTVHNLEPTVELTGAANVDEGDTETYTFETTDAGTADTFTSGTPNCGIGTLVSMSLSFNPATGDGSFDCKFTDDNPSLTASDSADVSITISDDDLGSGNGSLLVTVHNVSPTVVVTGAANADEGETKTYNFNTSDPGATDTFVHGTPDCGIGTYVPLSIAFSSTTGDGSFECKFTDDNPTGTASDLTSVSIEVSDDDLGSDTGSLDVTVHNLDPTVEVTGPANADEGETKTYDFDTTDSGTADTFTHGTPDCGTGNLVGPVVFSTATGDGSFDCKFTDDNPTGTASDPTSVSIMVTDDDTGSDSDSADLTVHNLAPSVVVSGPAVANEGETKTYTIDTTDAGTADTFTHGAADCGIGTLVGSVTFDNATGEGSFDCKFTDDDPTGTSSDPTSVSITVDDDDTGSDSGSQAVTVHNVAPTVTLSGASTADEGQTKTYTYTVSDPGTDTWTADAGYPTCGLNGDLVPSSHTQTASGGSFECYFADGNESTDVAIKVTDDDNGSDAASKKVIVVEIANVAPVVTAAADQSSDEGDSYSFALGSFTDPGTDSPWDVTVDWGDGSTPTMFQVTSAGSLGTQPHTYADGENDWTVTVTVADDTTSDSDTFSVHVDNVAPSIAISGAASVNEGSTYTLNLGAVTDPGADTVSSWLVHWGDGSTSTYTSGGDKTHTYADGPNDYEITVDLTDEDGTFLDRANDLSVHVNNAAPTVVISGAASVDESETLVTYTFDTTDPGTLDTFTAGTPSCGDSGTFVGPITFNTATGDGSFNCRFADDSPTATASDLSTLSITITDNDSGAGNDTHDVTVSNVAPTVVISGDASVNEGETLHTYTFDTTDAGSLDTFSNGAPNCGIGTLVSMSLTFDPATGDGSFKCKFIDDNPSLTTSDSANVSITISDDDLGSGTGNLLVTVHNVSPTVVVTGATDADEGLTTTYSFDTSDPGATDSFVHGDPDCGIGSYVTGSVVFSMATGDGSFDCKFTDDTPTGTASDLTSVSIDVSDDDLGSGTGSLGVTVHNLGPTVEVTGPDNADEGETKTYDFDTTDAGTADTFTHGTPDCGTGSFVAGSVVFSTATGDGSFQCKFTDDNPTGTGSDLTSVSITVTDDDTGSDSGGASLTVHNLAPSVVVSGPADANEGETKTYSIDTTDAGTADTFTHGAADCGIGTLVGSVTFDTATGDGSFDCKFTDDNPTGTASDLTSVSITVDDDDLGSDSGSQAVTVHNIAPTVSVGGADTVNEGTTHTYTFVVTDPGTADTFTVAAGYPTCGLHGDYVADSLVVNSGGGTFKCSFPDGPWDTDVTIKVIDDDGGSDADSEDVQIVHVNNVVPVLTPGGNQSSDEGESHAFDLGSFTDPGADSPWDVTVDWGDGSLDTTFSVTSAGSLGTQLHTYADGPLSWTVTVTVTDKNGASDSDTFTVTVANVAPTVTVSGDFADVNEGTTRTYTYTVTDPGVDSSATTVDESCGTGADYLADAAANSFQCKFLDGPGNSTVNVTANDHDPSNNLGDDPNTVTILNVAPTVTVSGDFADVNEGTTRTYTYTVTDPGVDSSATTVDESCGTGADYLADAAANSFQCKFLDGPGNSTVNVTANDHDPSNNLGDDPNTVTILNVAPTVTVSGDFADVNEGTTRTYTYTVTDPGVDGSATTVDESCGTGADYLADAAANSFQCKFLNGPGSSTVNVTANDHDPSNNLGDDPNTVTILNVAPTVTLSGPNTANSGETKTYTFTISDPAGAADPQTYVVGYPTCGTGGAVTGTPTITYNGGSFQCTFSSVGPSSTVAVKVNDGTANSNESSIVVAVNRPPTVNAGPDVSGAEGAAISLDGTVSDPDGNTFTVKWTYTAGAGVDALTTCSFANDVAIDTTITCTDDGTFTAKLEATDSHGVKSSDTATVTVSNANPVVTAPNPTPAPYAKGTPVTLSVNFTDAGSNDTHKAPAGGSCIVSWDDATPNTTGTVTEPVGATAGTCTASHSYAGPGVYTVTFTVTDDDGGSGTATIQVVVYDPNGGFITGGGWITVAAGSYTAEPTLTGRANFGFTSQYKKNALIPTGETEFNFQVGNMNFHSTAYSWLVVSSFKAQYKGTGTINGSGNYEFTLTAYDGQISGGGGTDKFRIRITGANNGAVVFDNKITGPTDTLDADPQAINGGSIVIHKA